MNLSRIIFSISFIAVTSICNNAEAKFDFNKNCINAYTNVINLNFQEGKRLLNVEKTTNPQNDIPLLIENYIDFLTLIVGENSKEFNVLKNNKDQRLEKLDKGDKSSPYYLYSKAQINLQWAFIRMRYEEFLTGAMEIRKAYIFTEDNAKKFPSFIPNKMMLGLLHVLIGSIPEKYKWMINLAGYNGSIKQGINEMEYVLKVTGSSSQFSYIHSEVVFLLSFMSMNITNDAEENTKMIYEIVKTDENKGPLVSFAKASLAMRKGLNDDAIRILTDHTDNPNAYPFHFLEFMLGSAYLNKLSLEAVSHFEKYATKFKGKNFIKASYQRIAWCYLVNNNIAKYNEYIKKVKLYGYTEIDEDKNAQKEAESGNVPNVYLLKGRLLFDGGYYKKALDALTEKSPNEVYKAKKDMIEFTYRLGRIYHKLDNTEKAVNYYKLTINIGSGSPYYYAANSALQLGLIYEKQKDFKNAKIYFEKCLSLNNSEFKYSIEQKAKAGLDRIKK
ncbi:MAG: tetratricopeptide repeat protein [Bacteroidales bacterium]|nr:tetratricopeptide repeat protein [Bacteroidales bacterium]